ncbi:MAG: cytidylate kinase [SAR202 cluster bacterium Io17-Chloro-G9]|nr:MAG: cytidylate kinase [SAR202 cluster bacterium Io17-Chloro-G9]
MTSYRNVITIDGPVAAGKTVVGRTLARHLGFDYLDTGNMYRAITWLAIRSKIPVEDAAALEKLALENPVRITSPEGDEVEVGGHHVGACLRGPEVNRRVSLVSQISGVRRAMVTQQREMAENGNMVMVGRDIGTVVLPGSELKIYLTASAQNRAQRRWQELQDKGQHRDFELVLEETQERDRLDSQREDSPLKPAEDSWTVDTSDLDVDQVVGLILDRANRLGGANRR